jgi:hypothetical protein
LRSRICLTSGHFESKALNEAMAEFCCVNL